MPYFLFEPDAPSAVHTQPPIAQSHPHWTYMYVQLRGNGSNGWYIRDTKQFQWLRILDAGVPENYRLELLLLQAAHPESMKGTRP